MKNGVNQKLKKLFKSEGGSVAVMMGFLAPVIVLGAGSAIDFVRFQEAKQVAVKALDSASLAAATELALGNLSEEEAAERALELFTANLTGQGSSEQTLDGGDPGDSAGTDVEGEGATRDVTIDNFAIEFDSASATVTATTDLSVPTLLSGLLGLSSLDTTLVSAASFRGAPGGVENLEFSFVLDVTGSMRHGGRLDALKVAMRDTINTLLPETGENAERIRVGLVPYSDAVNLGDYYLAAVGEDSVSARESENTCVTEREGRFDVSDRRPRDDRADRFFETDSILRSRETGACPEAELRPLTNDRDALLEDIDSFVADGFTGGHMGINWGINVLAQPYRQFWDRDARPARYDDENTRKVLVVMTDGAFNTSYFDDEDVEDIDDARSRNDLSRTTALRFCDLAKEEDHNIRVYTIAFQAGQTAEQMLRSCATEDDPDSENPIDHGPHFYDASSNEELQDAFGSIIGTELRVVLTQ